uniref:C2H2-type domain-containing protein n=1 Tax=Sinocyclocheilus rhinocerous TaxID=307959 RepID=A0A673IF53_9TELE
TISTHFKACLDTVSLLSGVKEAGFGDVQMVKDDDQVSGMQQPTLEVSGSDTDSRILLPSSNPLLVTNDFAAVASTSSKIQGMDSYHNARDVIFNQRRVGQTRNDRVPREKLFACTYCGKVFNRPKKVVIHQRIHTGEKPFKCNTCGKFFSEAGNLRKHQKVHTGERPYSCSQCGQTFAWIRNLKNHQQKYHPDMLTRVHTGERPFKCDTCGKLFTEAGNLKKHQRVHTGEKPFVCPRCGKRFAWICNLKTHQQLLYSTEPRT